MGKTDPVAWKRFVGRTGDEFELNCHGTIDVGESNITSVEYTFKRRQAYSYCHA